MPKLTRPLLQMSVIEVLIRAVELSPPQAKARRAAGEAKISIENNPVQAVVLPVEQIGIGAAQSIGHV